MTAPTPLALAAVRALPGGRRPPGRPGAATALPDPSAAGSRPTAPIRFDAPTLDLVLAPADTEPDRNRRVLGLTAAGLPLAEIGHRLNLSEQAVSQCRARLLEAYGATTSAHLVAVALARGDLPAPARPAPRVTDRQCQVLVRVAAGLSSHQVAAELGLAPTTASTHMKRLMWAFGATCRERLIVEAFRAGLLVASEDRRSLVLAGAS